MQVRWFLAALLIPAAACLAQLSDAEIRERMQKMNEKAAAATSRPAIASAAEPTPPPVVKHTGPVYYRIPLRGTVGVTFVASLLEKALADAATRSPTVVVLEIDSPGGHIFEVRKLVDVIAAYKPKLRIVVWNRQAISAAAITAMAADEIYMQPLATFGAATAFRVTSKGTAEAIEEKMQSAWRAQGRSAAEIGGHSPLLAEAMIDAEAAVYLGSEGGKPRVTATPEKGSAPLKDPGRLLTLTAQEAVRCGLARGTADNIADLGKALGHPGWKECEGVGAALAEWWEKRIEWAGKELVASKKRFQDTIDHAVANDPSTFNDYRDTGDPDSVRRWNTRSIQSADGLRRAEAELGRLAKLVEEYPHLPVNKQSLQESQGAIAKLRARLDAGRLKVPQRR